MRENFIGPWVTINFHVLLAGWGAYSNDGCKIFRTSFVWAGWVVRRTNLLEFVFQTKINFSIGNIFCRVIS